MCEEGVWRHGIQFHIFCTSALDENEYLPLCTGEFTFQRTQSHSKRRGKDKNFQHSFHESKPD